jgi:hypothetical protein
VVHAPVVCGGRRRLRRGGALAMIVAVSAACGDDAPRAERFCDRLHDDQSVLSSVPPTPEGLDQVVDAYRDAGEVAPLAVEDDWAVITALIEAAAEADPQDPVAIEQVRTEAVAATQSIERITAYAAETCGLDFSGLPLAPTSSTPGEPPVGGTAPATIAPGTLPPSGG